jgi:hypothetical protein
LPLSLIGSADLGNFLAPPGKSFEIHGQNFRGSAEGEIALTPQALALIQKHKLLDKGVPLAELARSSSRWPEDDGARHALLIDNFGEEGL